MRKWTTSVLGAVAAGMLVLASMADLPPAFTDLNLEAAKKQVEGTDRLVLVKFTAVWCGPCKAMDMTTWRDDKVVAWVKDHGVAIQVDVDKEQKVAADFQIAAMPTMVMLKGGNEIARKVGYMDAANTLAWLGDASSGKLAGGPKVDKQSHIMRARYATAKELSQSGRPDEATEEYVWLWEHMLDYEPAMLGVRGSFMANDMKALAARHRPALAAFIRLRDAAEDKKKADAADVRALDDWIVLNGIVGDDDRTLAWFEQAKGDKAGAALIRKAGFRIEPLLVERERWSDLALLYPEPLDVIRTQYQISTRIAGIQKDVPGVDAATKEEIQDSQWSSFREKAAILYVAFLTAGKDEVAASIVAEARKLYDKPRLLTGVVGFALKQGQARPSQRELLDEAEKAGADVRETRRQLEAALEKTK